MRVGEPESPLSSGGVPQRADLPAGGDPSLRPGTALGAGGGPGAGASAFSEGRGALEVMLWTALQQNFMLDASVWPVKTHDVLYMFDQLPALSLAEGHQAVGRLSDMASTLARSSRVWKLSGDPGGAPLP